MKPLTESIQDLKEVQTLLYNAYLLQNSAKCILSKHFDIDSNSEYEKNDFFNVYKINTERGLYQCEIATQNLIEKLNKY